MRVPIYEVFLVFQHAGGDVDALLDTCSSLHIDTAAARLCGVDLYYRADTDVLLLGVRLEAPAATRTLIDRICADAERVGASVLEPARLLPEDRKRFHAEHLPLYPLRVVGLPSITDAIRVLGVDLGVARARHAEGSGANPDPRGQRVEVWYQRGDDWQRGRVRSLTREGMYIVASAPPRRGEIVDIRLAAGEREVDVRGTVVHVTSEEAAVTIGSAGFGVRFLLAGVDDRQRLEGIVSAALSGGTATVRPAPARREARYPVRWPVSVMAGSAQASLQALDVSCHGLFVACRARALPRDLQVSIPIDDAGGPVRAGARVARSMQGQELAERGLAAGFGLELGVFSPGDDQRFHMFVARVARRAEFSVVVAAAEERIGELTSELMAAGYVATGVADPDTVIARASNAARPPDLVLVDESLERGRGPAVRAMRRALARCDVKVSFLETGQPAAAARSLADQTLLA